MSDATAPISCDNTLLCVAQIAGGHGIKGVLKILCFLDNPKDFQKYSPYLDASLKTYTFEVISITPKHILARLEGVQDRTQADDLKGLKLFLQRHHLKSLQEEEYYHHDLLGCSVLTESDEELGTLLHIDNYGAQDIFDITLKDGTSLLVPFQKDIVLEVSPNPNCPKEGYVKISKEYLSSLLSSNSKE